MLTPEQLIAAHKANVQTVAGLTAKAFEGWEKLVALNLQVAKTAIGEATDNAIAAMSVKDVQELLSLHTALLQPSAEKAAAYNRHLYEIFTATNAEITRAAEETAGDAQKKFISAFDSALKNAPAGTENATAFAKSTIAAANGAYESLQKALKQATEMADANFQALTSTAVKATQTTTARGKKAAAV